RGQGLDHFEAADPEALLQIAGGIGFATGEGAPDVADQLLGAGHAVAPFRGWTWGHTVDTPPGARAFTSTLVVSRSLSRSDEPHSPHDDVHQPSARRHDDAHDRLALEQRLDLLARHHVRLQRPRVEPGRHHQPQLQLAVDLYRHLDFFLTDQV